MSKQRTYGTAKKPRHVPWLSLFMILYFHFSELEELTGNFAVGILGGLLKREGKREKGTAVISTARHRCSGRDEGS